MKKTKVIDLIMERASEAMVNGDEISTINVLTWTIFIFSIAYKFFTKWYTKLKCFLTATISVPLANAKKNSFRSEHVPCCFVRILEF